MPRFPFVPSLSIRDHIMLFADCPIHSTALHSRTHTRASGSRYSMHLRKQGGQTVFHSRVPRTLYLLNMRRET